MFIDFKNVLGKLVTYYNNIEVCTDDVWLSLHSYALQHEAEILCEHCYNTLQVSLPHFSKQYQYIHGKEEGAHFHAKNWSHIIFKIKNHRLVQR
jgi:hypothetical protein